MQSRSEMGQAPGDDMPYEAVAIANHFLDLAKAKGESLDPMKVQKLVYFAHGWYLGLTDELLVNEQVEAWPYGPVIPSLWRAFRHYGNQVITDKVKRVRRLSTVPSDSFVDAPVEVYEPGLEDLPEMAEGTRPFLQRIYDVYGVFTGIQLSNLTHEPGTPWRQTWDENDGKPPRHTDIPRDTIRDHFRALAAM